jgi:cyanophycinase
MGRLLSALAYNPFAIGLGLDEDTAAFIGPDNSFEVLGSGGITIVDAGGIEYSSMATVAEGKPVEMVGVRLHVLVEGARFDLGTRRATPAPVPPDAD